MTSHDPDFWEKAGDVCGLYLNPPENALVWSVDEKTGMQAKSRVNPTRPASPGFPVRQGVAAIDALCQPRTTNGRHHARSDPLRAADRRLFRAVLAGGHSIVGFRNKDLLVRLYPRPAIDTAEVHRRCARVSRLIAKLRGHHLIAKVPRQRRYRVTRYGQRVLTAALTLHDDNFPDAYLAA